MAYGTVALDTIQSSTANTPPQFNDGNGTQIGTLCRAWVNFNGVTTATIRASFNISSVIRNGAGDYTLNFTNALSDANYAWSGSATNASNTNVVMGQNTPTAPTSSALRINTAQAGIAIADMQYVTVAVFR